MIRRLTLCASLILAPSALASWEDSCAYCHNPVAAKSKVHSVLQESGACGFCHTAGAEEHGGLMRKAPALCLECHDVNSEDSKSSHGVTQTGRACVSCHDPHSSDTGLLLRAELPALCFSCHDREVVKGDRTIPDIKAKVEQSTQGHPVVRECGICHLPHFGENERLLNARYPTRDFIRFSEETYELCFGCHDPQMFKKEIVGETGFRNDVRSGNRIVRVNLHYVHSVRPNSPDSGRSCSICHDPHGSPQERLIRPAAFKGKVQIVFKATETGGQCAKSCHAGAKAYERL